MSKADEAAAYFAKNYNCCQATLSPFAAELGLRVELAQRATAALGGGVARSGRTCGAVSGALIALGLKHYRSPADKAGVYAIGQEFLRRFEAARGSSQCRDLIGYDISTPAGHDEAVASGVLGEVCPGLVRGAVEIVEEMLGTDA